MCIRDSPYVVSIFIIFFASKCDDYKNKQEFEDVNLFSLFIFLIRYSLFFPFFEMSP